MIGLKRQTEVSYVLRGISRYNLYDQKDWGEIYSHPVFVFLSWIPTIILFSTSLFKKNVDDLLIVDTDIKHFPDDMSLNYFKQQLNSRSINSIFKWLEKRY